MQSGILALRQCEISYSIVRGSRGGRKCTASVSDLNKAARFARARAKFCKFQAAARAKFKRQ